MIIETFATLETIKAKLEAKKAAPKVTVAVETAEMKTKRLYGEYWKAKGVKAEKENGPWHYAR